MWRRLSFFMQKSGLFFFVSPLVIFLLISCSESSNNSEPDSIENIMMMETLRGRVESELCDRSSLYLQCLEITEKQCYLDVQKMRNTCWRMTSKSISKLSDPEVFSKIAQDYSECLMREHFNIGNFDKVAAEECLNNNPGDVIK